MPSLNKKQIIATVTDSLSHMELTQQQVAAVFESILELISTRLSQGDNVALRSFGAFDVQELKAKTGRNPKVPNEPIAIPARAVVKFRPSNELKAEVARALPYLRQQVR